MPRIHPHSRISSRSEQEFSRILSTLSDDWHVFPSVTFESLDKTGHIHARGEIDAILYHPDHGFLAVEVKAGSWRCDDGRWFHRPRHSLEWIAEDDPFEQANRGFLWLVEEIRKASRGRGRPRVAWALAVPDATRAECVVPEARRRLLLDRTICHDLKARLIAVMQVDDRAEHHPPTSIEIQQAWFDAIRPPVQIFESSEAALDRTRMEAGLASREIAFLAQALRDQKRLRAEGPPGSGKTVLALSWLEHQADVFRGYICFNAPLASWIGETSVVRSGRVEAHTFHDLGRLLIESVNPDAWPQEPAASFWKDEFLPLLAKSLDHLESQGLLEQFDALAIDEAQDFDPSWWPFIQRILAPDGSIGLFLDPLQDLRGIGSPLPPDLESIDPVRLDFVRRVPLAVQEWLAEQLDETWAPHPDLSSDDGSVELLSWSTVEDQHATLQKLLDHLTGPEAIPVQRILVCSLRATDQCHWAANLTQARWVKSHGFSTKKHVRMDTTLRAKGLEADVVIIPDLDRTAPDYKSKLIPRLRVAASRTTGRLYVMERGGGVP